MSIVKTELNKHNERATASFLFICIWQTVVASGNDCIILGPLMGALQGGPRGPWPTHNFGFVGHNAFDPGNNWPVCSLVVAYKIS